jgi:hypothetical protein
MSVTQTVEIPANHKLTIDVPREVPTGPVILTFTPAPANKAATTGDDGLYPDGVCPICAAHNYMPNAETIAVIEESRAMKRGEIPSTLRSFNSVDEMWEDLMRDEPEDLDD